VPTQQVSSSASLFSTLQSSTMPIFSFNRFFNPILIFCWHFSRTEWLSILFVLLDLLYFFFTFPFPRNDSRHTGRLLSIRAVDLAWRRDGVDTSRAARGDRREAAIKLATDGARGVVSHLLSLLCRKHSLFHGPLFFIHYLVILWPLSTLLSFFFDFSEQFLLSQLLMLDIV